MNKSIILLKAKLKKRGYSDSSISAAAEVMCEMLDEFNTQHWYDRDRYHDRIKALEAKLSRLDKASHSE